MRATDLNDCNSLKAAIPNANKASSGSHKETAQARAQEGRRGETEISDTLVGLAGFHPLGRIGTPLDIAQTVFFLLSDRATLISGTIVDGDAGVMASRN